jgi:protein SCO1/2
MATITKPKFFLIILPIAAIIASAIVGVTIWLGTKGPKYGGDFSLTYRNSGWNFSQDAKKLNLLYFGYAKCPDVCPMSLSLAGNAFRKLSQDELSNIRLIFVSVDAENDKPDDVADYALNFFPDFIGLSGSKQQIDQAISQFPASYMVEKNPKSYLGYSIMHTDRIFFLNRKGDMIDSTPGSSDSGSILNKIKEHL